MLNTSIHIRFSSHSSYYIETTKLGNMKWNTVGIDRKGTEFNAFLGLYTAMHPKNVSINTD